MGALARRLGGAAAARIEELVVVVAAEAVVATTEIVSAFSAAEVVISPSKSLAPLVAKVDTSRRSAGLPQCGHTGSGDE